MRFIAILVSLLMLFQLASPQAYSSEYLADGWLKITRQVVVNDAQGCLGGGITGGCSATGAVSPSVSGAGVPFSTVVRLTVTNSGPVERRGIEISESLSHIPEGARVEYSSAMPSIAGRLATWQIASLQPGESRNFSYSYSAAAREGQISRIPPVQVKAEPEKVSLSAPAESSVGGRISVRISSASGSPITGARVRVHYPDGTSQLVATDKGGIASFTASREGFYTYTVEGYSILSLSSTEVRKGQPEVPVLAAAATDSGMLPAITSLLPILLGIFVVSVAMLMAYNFFSAKREDGLSSYGQAAQQPAHGANAKDPQQPVSSGADIGQYGASPLSVSQNYSFSGSGSSSRKSPIEEAKEDKRVSDLTRGLVESRKRQMKGTEETHEGEVPFEALQNTFGWAGANGAGLDDAGKGAEESASIDDKLDDELSRLEADARESGETASDEGEIERAIAELEAIRAELRERKEKVHGASASDSDCGADDSGRENAGVPDSDEEESRQSGGSDAEASEDKESPFSNEGGLQPEDSVSDDGEPEEPAEKKPARKAKIQPRAQAKKMPSKGRIASRKSRKK
ncbi:MAG: hypothetical protein WC588_01160 [Candidatus Micrarchaeia archaeon]